MFKTGINGTISVVAGNTYNKSIQWNESNLEEVKWYNLQ